MKLLKVTAVLAIGYLVSGCAFILEGPTQDITVTSSPEGASCVFEREGRQVYTIDSTPQTIVVTRLKHDMELTCSLDGRPDETRHVKSGITPAVFGNIILGGLIGWGVDSATGADNNYDETIHIQFQPQSSQVPEGTEDLLGEGEPTS